MDKDLDGKLKLVQAMVNTDVQKNPDKNSQFISPQEREQVKNLARQGWTVAQMARALNRTQGEINLILELPSDL